MSVRRCVLFVLLIGAALPLLAQSSGPGEARDFWTAFGRHGNAALENAVGMKTEIPDLSGTYDVNGRAGNSAKTYETTLDVSRSKTLATQEGAKFNVYKLTWNWSNGKVLGVGMLIGTRLYVGYGFPGLALQIAAPLTLSADELQRHNQFWQAYDKEYYGKGVNKGKNGVTRLTIKKAPFTYNLGSRYPDPLSPRPARPAPGYYVLWVTPKGGYGHNIVQSMPAWKEGRYKVPGDYLNDDGNPAADVVSTVTWDVGRNGENYRVLETPLGSRRAAGSDLVARDKGEFDGTAFALPDGTILMLLAGTNKCGFGYYEVKNKTLTGPWAEQFAIDRGVETLTPSAAVLAKNAKFFGQ